MLLAVTFSTGSPLRVPHITSVSVSRMHGVTDHSLMFLSERTQIYLRARICQSIYMYSDLVLTLLSQTHGTDLINAFGPGDMTDYFIRFVRHLDPNGGSALHWPTYNTSSRLTLQFNDGSTPLSVTADTERSAAMSALFDLGLRFTFQDN